MVVIGIDASTNRTGMTVMNDGQYVEHKLIDLHKDKDSDTRIPKMMIEIVRYIQKIKPDAVIMEKSMLTSNTKVLQMLTMLAGSAMYYAVTHNIAFSNPLPSEWRKKVGIHTGKTKREELKRIAEAMVKQEYGIDEGDDVAESLLIARSAFDLPVIVLDENELWED